MHAVMKKILLLAIVTAFSVVSHAQLLVDSLGRVGIKAGDSIVNSTLSINAAGDATYDVYVKSNKTNGMYINNTYNNYSGTSYGLRVFNTANHRMATEAYGIHSQVKSLNNNPAGYMYGLLGQASTGMQNYGVLGFTPTSTNADACGAAICGSIYNIRPIISGFYAGYFVGDVHIEGSLFRTGGCYSSTPEPRNIQNTISLSDASIATASVNGSAHVGTLGKIAMIDAVKYSVTPVQHSTDSVATMSMAQNDSVSTVYGLDVETLQAQFPSLVKVSSNGTVGIDYTGLVPILLQSIKELQAKVNALEAAQGGGGLVAFATEKPIGTTEMTALNVAANIVATLSQNTPNPFSEATTIAFTLPENVGEAMICIYDMNGKQLEQIAIEERGSASVKIDGYKFEAGMYLYSLIADGAVIDTKRMVLTK